MHISESIIHSVIPGNKDFRVQTVHMFTATVDVYFKTQSRRSISVLRLWTKSQEY